MGVTATPTEDEVEAFGERRPSPSPLTSYSHANMATRNNRPDSPSLNWSSLQHLFETAVPCVLIILDCCFAANAARDTAEGTTKEILAACGRENPTLGVCERSFSSALVEELQAFGGTPFTVAMLHSRLVTMRWRLAFTPIYALLSENGGSSIAISPVCHVSTLDCLTRIPLLRSDKFCSERFLLTLFENLFDHR